ncbi:PREDICTED: leucine-rich repeat-containing protein 25, partial [Gekko japonicus]|uniref:Leucine-rich repeat-containing protein 25 n=1 Tax=Gekko japonicus TaxID=146911 RepID=A0ABM1KS44_GEKJA
PPSFQRKKELLRCPPLSPKCPSPEAASQLPRDQRKALEIRMRGLLATLLFLHLRHPLEAACPPDNLITQTSSSGALSWERLDASKTYVNLSGTNVTRIHGIPGRNSSLEEMDLSHNCLSSLPVGFLNHTTKLKRLFLQSNRLRQLPPAFFEETCHLKELRLEGNPLPSVPSSLFRLCLETLSVDCHCAMTRSISDYCQRRNCTQSILCQCSSPQGFLNVTDFHARQCQGLSVAVYAALAVSTLALLLGAVVAYVLIRRRKGATMSQEKWEPSTSNGAPRYISHTSPQVDLAQGTGSHADYENVFIGQPQEAGGGHKERYSRKQPKSSRSHRKVQKDEPPQGEQAIYANTQELYYNYAGTPAPPDEDLYVMPDQ